MLEPDSNHGVDTYIASFHLPLQPPAQGFLDPADVLKPARQRRPANVSSEGVECGNRRNHDPLLSLLDTSATLLSVNTIDSTRQAVAGRGTPQLNGLHDVVQEINDTYLEGIFSNEDKVENDIYRRVDYNSCLRTLKENSDKRLLNCVSCLTRGQHRHYAPWVRLHFETGTIPPVSDDYRDMTNVIDLARQEQKFFLRKFRSEILACPQCAMERGRQRRQVKLGKAEGDSSSALELPPHCCWDHNYLDSLYIEPFVKRWWVYHVARRLHSFLSLSQRGGSVLGDTDGTRWASENIWSLKNTFLSERKRMASENATSDRTTVKVQAFMTSTSSELADYCVQHTLSTRAAKDSRQQSLATPPVYPLPREKLAALHLPEVAAGEVWEETVDGTHTLHQPFLQPLHRRTICALTEKKLPSLTHASLMVSMEALLELAAAHLSYYKSDFQLPIRVRSALSEDGTYYTEEVAIGDPLPRQPISRRRLNGVAVKCLLHEVPFLVSCRRSSDPCAAASWRMSGEGTALHKSKCCAEVHMTPEDQRQCLRFHVLADAAYDLQTGRPVFFVIKMEYNNKGYTVCPDDGDEFYYEQFTNREATELILLFQCFPSAIVYIHHVNAYTTSIMSVDTLTIHDLDRFMRTAHINTHAELRRMWSSAFDVLEATLHAISIAVAVRIAEGDQCSTFILSTDGGDPQLCLSTVEHHYPNLEALSGAREDAEAGTFIEQSSAHVCKREYLPPYLWPHTDRIPFTYNTKPPSSMRVNRTTTDRHPEAYYVTHDVWEHTSQTYAVTPVEGAALSDFCPPLVQSLDRPT